MTQSVQRGAGPSSLDPHFGYVRFGVGRSGLSRSFDNLPQLGRLVPEHGIGIGHDRRGGTVIGFQLEDP